VYPNPAVSAAPARPALYRGWAVVLVAAAAMVGTLPGRTQGLGLITEPLIAELGLDRVTYAQLNLWATIAGAGFAIGVGRLMDRYGARVVLTAVAASLGVVVCAMSRARSAVDLGVWMMLTRGLGQSALSVVSIATVGHWFVRRIDFAMAVYSVALSVGFMAAFPLVGWLVQAYGWRSAWLGVGLALIAGLAPLAWLVVRRSPAAIGLEPDGARAGSDRGQTGVRPRSDPGLTPPAAPPGRSGGERTLDSSLSDALATPTFWVFAVGTALYGLVASGIGLFNESILAERGFGPTVYYRTLAVTAMTGLAGNFLGGYLATRAGLARLLAASLFILAAGLAVLPHVESETQVMAWAATMGIGGGIVMVLFFSVWPVLYGRRHLGRIQGSAQALTVLASAVGPLLLALCVSWTGSYQAMFRILAAIIAGTGIAAICVRLPSTGGR
jgi:MFS family permease